MFMSLKEQLLADLKEAMKQKDTILKDTIQMVRAGILQIEKDKKIELDDDGVIEVVAKELKKKVGILKSYLPAQLTIEEVKVIVTGAVAEVNASSMRDMGKVMSLVSPKVKGRADGKTVSDIVKQVLSGK